MECFRRPCMSSRGRWRAAGAGDSPSGSSPGRWRRPPASDRRPGRGSGHACSRSARRPIGRGVPSERRRQRRSAREARSSTRQNVKGSSGRACNRSPLNAPIAFPEPVCREAAIPGQSSCCRRPLFSVAHEKDQARNEADDEVDGRDVACKTGQQADEIEAGGDADPETAAGKEPEQEAGCFPFSGTDRKTSVSRTPMIRERRREAPKKKIMASDVPS